MPTRIRRASVLLLTMGISGSLVTGEVRAADVEVVPTGVVATDVANVQTAVDQGGTVLLGSRNAAGEPMAFNFGEPTREEGRWVDVTTDVEIVGERVEGAETTIHGGWYPIDSRAGANLTVRNINFERPLLGAVFAANFSPTSCTGPHKGSGDVTISGADVRDVIGGSRGNAEVLMACGHDVVIADNVIAGVHARRGIGISTFRNSGSVEIVGNRVSDTALNAIEATANAAAVRISHNVLRPGPGLAGSPAFGIEINGTGAYTVDRNDVLTESPVSIGIWALGWTAFDFGTVTNAVITHNHVVMAPTQPYFDGNFYNDGIDLVGLVSESYVGQNEIEGHGAAALGLWQGPESDLGHNTLVGNNIANASTDLADVFLDFPTHHTVLKGRSGTVIDLGTDNLISGFTKGGMPGSGPQVSEAMRFHRDSATARAEDRSAPHKAG